MSMTQHLKQMNNGLPTGGDGIILSRPLWVGDLTLESSVAAETDETNSKVIKVEETVDTFFTAVCPIPEDYDEQSDFLKVRVLASMLTVSTDDDVELDMAAYKKTPGSALGSDLNPDPPGTILSTTEQWLEFDLSGNGFVHDDLLTFKLKSNGGNDTNGEEILIHAIQLQWKSMIVPSALADRDS